MVVKIITFSFLLGHAASHLVGDGSQREREKKNKSLVLSALFFPKYLII